MPLDDQLMRKQTTSTDEFSNSADKAGVMRRQQRDESEEGGASDLRSIRKSGTREKKKKLKNELKNKLVGNQKSLSFETSKLLQTAWENIFASFGISYLYVYVHLFLQQIFGKKLFVPLGEEWLDRPNIPVEKRKKLSKWFKIIEPMGVGCLTIVLFIAIIFAFSIPALIIEVVSNPLHAFIKIIWDDVWSFLSGQ